MTRSAASTLCALSGVLYFLTFLSFDLFPLAWICLVPALYAVRDASPRQAFAYGALFGAITNAGGFYWVIDLIVEFGGLPVPVATLGYLLLCLYHGLLLAFLLTFVRLADRDLGIAPVWSLPVAFPALELLYPLLFPSFIGNSQYRFSALTQIVEITGMLGLTALIALVNGAVYELIDARRSTRTIQRLRILVPLSTVVLCIAYGLFRLPAVDAMVAAAATIKVAVVQTNIGGREKESNPSAFLNAHVQTSREVLAAHPDVDLLIWPESVYDRYVEKSRGVIDGRIAIDLDRPLILGLLSVEHTGIDGPREYFNSVALLSPNGEVLSSFDKVELLAFGETLPLSETIPVIKTWLPSVGGFSPGDSFDHLRLDDISLLPMICYEDTIPSLVRRIWRESGPPDVLVNVTNDSWYGDTHEPMIHLVLSSFRSIETRRALIRSTNTGISAIVDPAGRVVRRTGQWKEETLIADVPLIEDGSWTVYMRVGDLLGWMAASLTALGIALSLRSSRRSNAHAKHA